MYRRYDDQTRGKIITAANEVRTKNGTWQEALAAAKAVGYQSSLIGLQKLISKPLKKKPGRPKGSKNQAKPQSSASSFSEIGALVETVANQRALQIVENTFAIALAELKRKVKK